MEDVSPVWGLYDKLPSTEMIEHFVITITEAVNSFSDIPESIRREMLNECYWWYVYCLKCGRLYGRESSLKSELRKLYKKYREDLSGFDRFMEKVRNAFKTICSL